MEDHADVAQLVERDLAKVEVAGSSPVVRSKDGGLIAFIDVPKSRIPPRSRDFGLFRLIGM